MILVVRVKLQVFSVIILKNKETRFVAAGTKWKSSLSAVATDRID